MQTRLHSLHLGTLPYGRCISGLGISLRVFELQGEREELCWLGTYQKCLIMDCLKPNALSFGTLFIITATGIYSAVFKHPRLKGMSSCLVTAVCGTVPPFRPCCQMTIQNCKSHFQAYLCGCTYWVTRCRIHRNRGLKGQRPCLFCLIPKQELGSVSGGWQARESITELLQQYGESSKKDVLEACKKLGLKGIEVCATNLEHITVFTSFTERFPISNGYPFFLSTNCVL
jgi:hypothetical protein